MNGEAPVFDQVIAQALHLPVIQKVQLVEKLMEALEKGLATSARQSQTSSFPVWRIG
jgi:hypothetical protein